MKNGLLLKSKKSEMMGFKNLLDIFIEFCALIS